MNEQKKKLNQIRWALFDVADAIGVLHPHYYELRRHADDIYELYRTFNSAMEEN